MMYYDFWGIKNYRGLDAVFEDCFVTLRSLISGVFAKTLQAIENEDNQNN